MKEKELMKIIGSYAGNRKCLITLGKLLAMVSAWVAMVPCYDLWKIIRIAVNGSDFSGIAPIAWHAVGITILGMLLYIAALLCTHMAAFRVQANMRSALMRKIVTLPLGIFDKDGTGRIRRIVNESTAATETFIAHNLPDKAVAAATPIGLLVLMLAFDWRIGLICAIPSVIGFAFMMGMMGKGMQKKMAEYQNALEAMSNEAVEYVRGIPVVKTFGQTVHSFARFKKTIQDYGTWVIAYTVHLRRFMIGFMTGINATFVALVFAAYFFARNGVTADLVLSMMYYIIVTPLLSVTLTKMAYSGEQEMVVIDAIKRIDSILKLEPLAEGTTNLSPADASVELDHISYRYQDTQRDAVHDLSIRIEAGEHIALVGPSGGGKTTAASLITRFFDVTEGCVRIGGVDVKEISQQKLMQTVSFVFQDSKLLKTSILENVRMGKPEASEAEVLSALEKAQCSDILEKLPEGIHTVIGAKGTYLSGGEQQRISIARAILKNAPILILDEATAFADPDNEAKIQAAFEQLAAGKTLIMIAHRLSTVTNADRICVLKDGTLAESGSHEELMARNGLYQRMFTEYSKSVQWKVGVL